ncbi:breast carcinoma-amplified sequence 3, partial [Biomphalaria glabrata]
VRRVAPAAPRVPVIHLHLGSAPSGHGGDAGTGAAQRLAAVVEGLRWGERNKEGH